MRFQRFVLRFIMYIVYWLIKSSSHTIRRKTAQVPKIIYSWRHYSLFWQVFFVKWSCRYKPILANQPQQTTDGIICWFYRSVKKPKYTMDSNNQDTKLSGIPKFSWGHQRAYTGVDLFNKSVLEFLCIETWS